MAKTTLYIILCCLGLALATLAYLTTLLLGLSVYVAAVFTIALCLGAYIGRSHLVPSTGLDSTPLDFKGLLILTASLAFIIYKVYGFEEKYGHWDAWWFWNARANYLTRPADWRLAFSGQQYGTIFTVPVAHSDYPPFLPLLNAYCWRLMGVQPAVVPFAWSLFSLLLIPAVLFIEIYRRSKLIGALSLLYFVLQEHIIQLGSGQTADGWIALFTLLAAVCFQQFRDTGLRAYALLIGAVLGCSLWTKNEGLIIAGVFTAFITGALTKRRALRQFLAGLLIPLLALILFKALLAPANDLVGSQNSDVLQKLTDAGRYDYIRQLIWDMIKLFYPSLPYMLGAYLILLFAQRSFPDKVMLIVLSCFLCFLGGYVVSPHNLGWHVGTSSDRLVFQLLPTFLWAIALRLSNFRFPFRQPR